jgi:hypothetical protein
MKKLVLLLLLPMTALADSNTYFEIGAGNNTNITPNNTPWNDGGGVGAYFSLRNQWDNGLFIQWSHYSQYDVGAPFNYDPESSLDHFGIGMRFKLR